MLGAAIRSIMRPQLGQMIRTHPRVLALFHDDPADYKVTRRSEKGVSGSQIQSGKYLAWDDYNPLLTGASFYSIVDQMRKADGDVAAALDICKLPLQRTDARIVVEDEGKADNEDRQLADICNDKLLGVGVTHETWQEQLRNILLMFDFGYSVSEKVWDVDGEGIVVPVRVAPRHPRTITDFRIEDGILTDVIQDGSGEGKSSTLDIPAPLYASVYSWRREGANFRGQSLLRVMYKHWWYKEQLYKIDAIRLDRWGTGIPKAMVKEGKELKPREKSDLISTMKDLRGNQRSFLIHPEAIDINLLTPEGQGGALGLMDSVNHHSMMIFRSVLGQFMSQGQQPFGNYGSTRSFTDLFLFSLYAAAKFVEDKYTRQHIVPFLGLNFNLELPDGRRRMIPRLKFADVQRFDMGLISEVLSRLMSSKAVTPDDTLEAFLRRTFGWPELPKEFSRAFMREQAAMQQPQPGEPNTPPDPNTPPEGGRPPEPTADQNRNVPAKN